MTLGVPVAVSDISCLKEMCLEAAIYFDPESVEDIVNQLKLVIENGELRKELIAKGYENIKRFSWRRMAQETLNAYRC